MRGTPRTPTHHEQLHALLADLLQAQEQRWEEAQVRMFQSLGGTMLRGARPVAIGASAGGTARPATANGSLVGFALRETSGAAIATVVITNGVGDLVLPITLAAGESARDWFGPGGISYAEGLNVAITGAVDGVVFLRGPQP